MTKHVTNVVEFLNNHYTIKERKRLLTRHRSTLRIYFKPRSLQKGQICNGQRSLYVRITVNGVQAAAFSTGISFEAGTWDLATRRIKGHSAKVDEKNRTIAQIENDLLCLYNDLRQQGVNVTAQMLKDLYRGNRLKSSEHLVLTEYYLNFLSSHTHMISKSTMKSYKSRLVMLLNYLKSIGQPNTTIDQINPKWAMAFHLYILNQNCGLEHARRAVQTVSKVLDFAVIKGDLDNNSLKSLSLPRSRKKPIKYLTMVEVEQLQLCPYFNDRLQKAVDCFLLQVFTGMGYNELLMFHPATHLKEDSDGQQWIMINRHKSGTLSMIPVTSQAKALLQKYNYALPVITNQKMNDFIKEAAKIAGISNPDEITTHVARKTAGMYMLNHGLSLETVSKVLGHKSVKMTEMYYAELLTDTIKQNFKKSGLL